MVWEDSYLLKGSREMWLMDQEVIVNKVSCFIQAFLTYAFGFFFLQEYRLYAFVPAGFVLLRGRAGFMVLR